MASDVEKCEPIYKKVPGWNCSTADARKYKDLPAKARKYLEFLAELTGARLAIVSVGASRAQTIRVRS
jgi:adenylosuccinate synthase